MDKSIFDQEVAKTRSKAEWENMNTYDRTMVACQIIMHAEERIPSWPVIRTLIGKGSSKDIGNAKSDFLKKVGLAREIASSAQPIEDLSRSASQLLLLAWQRGKEHAIDNIRSSIHESQRFDAASEQVFQHESELAHLKAKIESLQMENQELRQLCATLEAQLKGE